MEVIKTAYGDIPVEVVSQGQRPLVLAIRGAFPGEHDLEWLRPEGCDIAFLHLPGFYSPLIGVLSLAAFVAAFDEVIQRRFAGRPITVLGVSTGAVVAAGLRSPEIGARVLVEPFFSTARVWPLHLQLQPRLAAAGALATWWAWAILGIAPDRLEDRDYAGVLDGAAPLLAVVGDQPLDPPRALVRLPSLTSLEDRDRLVRHGAQVSIAASGHDAPRDDPETVSAVLADAIRATLRADAQRPAQPD